MWNLQKELTLRTFKICRFEIIDGVKYVYCIKHAYKFLLREQVGLRPFFDACVNVFLVYSWNKYFPWTCRLIYPLLRWFKEEPLIIMIIRFLSLIISWFINDNRVHLSSLVSGTCLRVLGTLLHMQEHCFYITDIPKFFLLTFINELASSIV